MAGHVALRLRVPAGFPHPQARCETVRLRLLEALASVPARAIAPGVRNGHAVVLAGSHLIATPLPQEAEANRTSPALLAWTWANRLRAALGAAPLGLEAVPWRGLPGMRPAVASWYGYETGGRRTASGEPFDPRRRTAAHRWLPFGTVVRVVYPATGKQVVAVINDRGPFVPGRDLDLSYGAAQELGMVRAGVARVYMEVVHRASHTPRR